MSELVSVEWLKENIDNQDLVLLDVSIKKVTGSKSSEFDSVTIENARYFDLKGKFTDKSSPFPNTFPSPIQFETECQKLGINSNSKIVVFDNLGIYSSPRVWWMFKTMGHEDVHVLNGGLPEWIKKGYKVKEKKTELYESGNFKAHLQKQNVKYYQDILDNVTSKSFTVVDARSEGRFKGIDEEPRKHLKSGSIPNSINIPYQEVLDNGKFKSEKELRELFQDKTFETDELVYSCGSGLTACIVMLASEIVFKKGRNVYDGSWSEWAELQNLRT